MIKTFEQYINENLTSLVDRYKNNHGIKKEDELTEDVVRSYLDESANSIAHSHTTLFNCKGISIHYEGDVPVVDIDGDWCFKRDACVDGKFPFKFGKVSGDFYCDCIGLVSLEGSPKKVGGVFYCGNNKLTSLEGGPEKVGSAYSCAYNDNLTSLKGSPKEVGRSFAFNNCKNLTSIEGCPKIIPGSFFGNDCNYNSLKGCPIEVGEHFYCWHNPFSSFDYFPDKVGGDVYCSVDTIPQEIKDRVKGSFTNTKM